MSWNYNLVVILGAGASKPLGILTSKEIVKEFLETESARPLSDFKNVIIKEEWDIEKLLRLIQHVKMFGEEPPLRTLLGKTYTRRLERKTNQLNKSYKSIYDELLDFIRNICLKPNHTKAMEIYKPLLNLRKKVIVKIFTTNYDTAIEDVCRNLQIRYNDGFVSDPFDDYPKFHPEIFGRGNPQLYKLHGSVNWWTDESRQDVFRLSLNLKGIAGLQTMMIYPAEVESAFNYPFNFLQSHYILSLMYADRIIAIGHRFGDINISLPIKALLEKPDFKLTIVNDAAEEIKKKVFNNSSKIMAIPNKIEEWMPEGMEEVRKQVEAFEAEREEERKEEAERRRKEQAELEERIRKEIEGRQRPYTPFLTTQRVEIPLSDIRLEPSTIGIDWARLGTLGTTICPNCQRNISPTLNNKCPYCGRNL